MHFPALVLVASMATAAIGTPLTATALQGRALQFRSYAKFQISDGKAGNALEEVKAEFPVRIYHQPTNAHN